MPIEDLHYLYNNSVKENIIILIDSDKRDKKIWQEPNEFQIDFDEPFKLVYGIDVLDISVPRTMYGIEDHNNMLRFSVGQVNTNDTDSYQTVKIDSRDYSLQEFIAIMNDSDLYENNIKVSTILENIEENRNSVLTFTNVDNPPKPFVFDMQHSTLASNIGFNSYAQHANYNKYLKVDSATNDNLFASVPIGKESLVLSYVASIPFTSSRGFFMRLVFYEETATRARPLNASNQTLYSDVSEVTYTDKKEVGFYLSNLVVAHDEEAEEDEEEENIRFVIYQLDVSNMDVSQEELAEFESKMTENLNVENMFDLDALITIIDDRRYVNESTLTILNRNDESFRMLHNSATNSYEWRSVDNHFNMIPIRPLGNILHFVYGETSSSRFVDSVVKRIDYEVCFVKSFKITSPGLVKLFGERYVIVHCDNIENHLRGSMVYDKYSPGLALVNLSTLGYTQSRNDFFGVKYKQFHPIGKLSNLKFRVNRPDGELYNFKNVNWHMLLSVKYYAAKNPTDVFNSYTLNPNYDPNFIEYQTKHDVLMNDEQDGNTSSESEDEEDANFDNSIYFRNKYLKMEQDLERKFNRT